MTGAVTQPKADATEATTRPATPCTSTSNYVACRRRVATHDQPVSRNRVGLYALRTTLCQKNRGSRRKWKHRPSGASTESRCHGSHHSTGIGKLPPVACRRASVAAHDQSVSRNQVGLYALRTTLCGNRSRVPPRKLDSCSNMFEGCARESLGEPSVSTRVPPRQRVDPPPTTRSARGTPRR